MIRLPEKLKLSTLALSDPLSKETETKRTHLMFTACASILLTVYGLKINKTPWLDIEVPAGAPNILHGALSVALVYTLIVFLFHACTDFTRWWIAREVVALDGYQGFLVKLHNHLNAIARLLNESELPLPEDLSRSQLAHVTAVSQVDSLDTELRRLQKRHSTLTTAQFLRLALIDIAVPLILAAVAMTKVSEALWPFLSAIAR